MLGQDLLHHQVERAGLAAGHLGLARVAGLQPLEVLARVRQAVGVVDAQRVQVAAIDRAYHQFTGEQEDFGEIAYQCKRLIIGSLLFSELNWLVEAIYRITRANRRRCDFTRNRLRLALAEIAAGFPVYRTYLREGDTPSAATAQSIWRRSAARGGSPSRR